MNPNLSATTEPNTKETCGFISQRGSFFASISSDNLDPIEIFKHLESYYYSYSSEKSILIVVSECLSLAKEAQAIAIACAMGDVVYLGSQGESEIVLVRDGKEITLAKNGEPRSMSGKIQSGDILVLKSREKGSVRISVGAKEIEERQTEHVSALKRYSLKVVDKLLELIKRREMHLVNEHDFKRSRGKRAVIFGVAMLLILIVSVVIGMRRREEITLKGELEKQLSGVAADLEQARSWKGLKDEDAKLLLLKARENVLALEKSFPGKDEVAILKTSIEESLGDIAGIYKTRPNLFLDLALVSSNLTVSRMIVTEENLFVFDKDQKRLVKINLQNKKTEVVAGPENLSGISDIAAYSERVFLVGDEGVFEATSGKTKIINKDWEGEILISSFAGNLYILDKSESQIYRYAGAGGGFSSKLPWLATDIKVDFSDAQSWVIDGSIWVRGKDFQKFSLGKSDFFNQIQVPEATTSFATDEQLDNLYFLDSDKSNIFVLSKKGEFVGVYEDEIFSSMRLVVVSGETGKIILSDGQKLYELEIKDRE